MRRSENIFCSIWYEMMEWLECLLSIGRAIIPPIMLYILVAHANSIYIPYLDQEISITAMRCFIIGVHSISMWFGFRNESSRGLLYDLCSCFLASELVLFLYFTQHQFFISLTITIGLIVGIIILLTYGRRQLNRYFYEGYVPQNLMDDIIATSKNNQHTHSILSVALRRYLTIGIACAFLLPSIAVISFYGTNGILQRGSEHAIIDKQENNQLLLNYQTILLLHDETWFSLSDQEQIDVLQIVADIETNYMGIPSVSVINCHLENRTIGAYDHTTRSVQIDLEKHSGYQPIEYENTVLHECRHAFQHDCVDSLDWSDPDVLTGIYYAQARKWRSEHANYISLVEDREAYYDQAIEIDARQYSEAGIYVYQKYLDLGSLPVR